MIEHFLTSVIENTHPQIQKWMGEGFLKEKSEQYLNSIIPHITDTERAKGYHEYCFIEGSEAKDYLWRFLEMSNGRKLIAVINFMGMDLAKPFIRVMAMEPLLSSVAELEELAAYLKKEFAVFSPPRICIQDGKNEWREETDKLKFDNWYVAAPLASLKNSDLTIRANLRLEPAMNLDFYDWYEREYHLFLKEHPDHRIWLQLTERGEFQRMIDSCTCYLCFLGEERIGVIAAEYQEDKFLYGYCVFEELIQQSHRGQGLGKEMQRLMISHLPIREERDLVWGTIDSDNKISLKTALACGRQKVGKWVYYNT